jgi:hypothetical protein
VRGAVAAPVEVWSSGKRLRCRRRESGRSAGPRRRDTGFLRVAPEFRAGLLPRLAGTLAQLPYRQPGKVKHNAARFSHRRHLHN